jgi:hypothetical protein
MRTITPAQLARLQTLCSQMTQSVIGFDGGREGRLAWAGTLLGRTVPTFSALGFHDARLLIDAAQGELGHRAPLKPGSKRNQAHKHTAEDALRAGVDGRKDDVVFVQRPEIVSAEDLETIASYYQRLGWDKARFDAWLAGSSSPIKPGKVIHTTRQANRVRWALKGMLQDAGLWVDWSKG